MNSSSSRSRQIQRRVFRLEGLEDRNLLSVASMAFHSARPQTAEIHAAVLNKTTRFPVTALSGTAIGQIAPNGVYSAAPAGFVSYSGHGAARPIGPTLIGFQFKPTANGTSTTVANGSLLLTDSATGEQVIVGFSGSGATVSRGRPFKAVLTGTVEGGTGQFNYATGTFSATAQFSGSGRFSLRYHISIA